MKKIAKKAVKKTVKKTSSLKQPAKRGAGRSVRLAVKKTARAAASAAQGNFSKEEMAQVTACLKGMRDSVSKTVEEKKKLDLPEPEVGDSIDQASQSLEKEILFELSDTEMGELGDIEAALRKIENSTYGVCEHCKRPIEKKRIKAIPSARYCLVCQSGSEKQRAR